MTITLANPNDPVNPYVGTISADFLEITWDVSNIDGKSTICRVDVDECSDGTDNCDAQPYPAVCTNNVGGFTCDFDPAILIPATDDGFTPWTDKTTGNEKKQNSFIGTAWYCPQEVPGSLSYALHPRISCSISYAEKIRQFFLKN